MDAIDLKLTNVSESTEIQYLDVSIGDSGDFDLEDGLDSSIMVSLFSDSRATSEEIQDPILRKGWWGNEVSEFPGHLIGSKLWLLDQARVTASTVRLTKAYMEECLAWLVKDKYVASIAVESAPALVNGKTGIQSTLELKIKGAKKDTKTFKLVTKTFN